MNEMQEVLLDIRNLSTILHTEKARVRAVDGVDLSLQRGETFALLGESGCGKSMTALSIMRLLPLSGEITSGEVLLDGEDLLELPERDMRRVRGGRLGMIFQEPMTSLNPVLTIGEQIAEALRLHADEAEKAADARVQSLLKAVGIPDPQMRSREYPHQLSGGMKQRVMIAMALAGDPQLLIADEPTTALDVTIQAQVLELIKDLQIRNHTSILLITHDLGVVSEMADRVAVMYAGQIVEVASREQFFSRPRHPYSRKLFLSLPVKQKRNQPLEVIHGGVPSLTQRFSGCRFVDRCDLADERCHNEVPVWRETGNGEGVRCHYPEKAFETAQKADALFANQGTEKILKDLLDVEGLKVHFPIQRGILRRTVGYVKAVDGVSLLIQAGKTLALVGESGCGKTTVGKGILQLIRPTAGKVMFDGKVLNHLKGRDLQQHRSDLQIIFQDPMASMNPRMLIKDIIEEGMKAQDVGGNATERAARINELLQQVGLPESAVNRYPHEFSGGQRQRICIARALAVNPRLIICDEPTSALDVSVQAQILNQLKQLQSERDLAYLFITHNISVVAYLADQVAVMYLGRIVEQGEVEEVLENPRHPYTQALLSAVPVIDDAGRGPVIRLQGDMPSPANPPAGCYFHPRCTMAIDVCRESYPEEIKLSPTHRVSCLRIDQ